MKKLIILLSITLLSACMGDDCGEYGSFLDLMNGTTNKDCEERSSYSYSYTYSYSYSYSYSYLLFVHVLVRLCCECRE